MVACEVHSVSRWISSIVPVSCPTEGRLGGTARHSTIFQLRRKGPNSRLSSTSCPYTAVVHLSFLSGLPYFVLFRFGILCEGCCKADKLQLEAVVPSSLPSMDVNLLPSVSLAEFSACFRISASVLGPLSLRLRRPSRPWPSQGPSAASFPPPSASAPS